MKKFVEIKFKGTDELIKLAEERCMLLKKNVETAVGRTVLLGVARIASDCPVDTGRLRASISGDFADLAGIDLSGDSQEIAEGRQQSTTGFSGMEGRIGTNVEYALYIEYGHKVTGPEKLTPKQLRYLFATGKLKVVKTSGGKSFLVPGTKAGQHNRINRRAGISGRVKGKGMFRKNIPVLQRNLDQEMNKAIQATSEDKLLRVRAG